jgi:translation initiation factor 3 subunit M
VYSQLLDIFAEQDLEDYNDFNDEHEGWVEKEKLDHDKLHRKMRLLTFASVAASTPSREIDYNSIVKALQIPVEDVEMWAIDVVRAGLVEGKLSQRRKTFLVHKVTYRVFAEKQWQELSTRVDMWRTTLRNVLATVRTEQVNAKAQKDRDVQEIERKLANASMGGGQQGQGHGGRRERQPQQQQKKDRADDDD